MIQGSLARRYARALMEIGRDKGISERLGAELSALAGLFEKDETIKNLFVAPLMGKDVRESIIEEICKSQGLHEVMLQFLKLLNQKGRLPYLEQIALAYRDLSDKAEGRVRAEVVSAAPLSDQDRDRVKESLEKITGKQVLMSVDVDQELIGGIVARVAGRLLDGSVKTQLRAVEDRLKAEENI